MFRSFSGGGRDGRYPSDKPHIPAWVRFSTESDRTSEREPKGQLVSEHVVKGAISRVAPVSGMTEVGDTLVFAEVICSIVD